MRVQTEQPKHPNGVPIHENKISEEVPKKIKKKGEKNGERRNTGQKGHIGYECHKW